MSVIVDASFAGAWLLRDETSPDANLILARILRGEESLIVPAIWFYEMTNLLIMAARRGRISQKDITVGLDLLNAIPIQAHEHRGKLTLERTARFADRFNLSAYDAAYIELADRLQMSLYSFDGKMRQAAMDLDLNGTE